MTDDAERKAIVDTLGGFGWRECPKCGAMNEANNYKCPLCGQARFGG